MHSLRTGLAIKGAARSATALADIERDLVAELDGLEAAVV